MDNNNTSKSEIDKLWEAYEYLDSKISDFLNNNAIVMGVQNIDKKISTVLERLGAIDQKLNEHERRLNRLDDSSIILARASKASTEKFDDMELFREKFQLWFGAILLTGILVGSVFKFLPEQNWITYIALTIVGFIFGKSAIKSVISYIRNGNGNGGKK